MSVERAFCRLFEALSGEDGDQVWVAQEPIHLPGQYENSVTSETFDLGPALDEDEWEAMRDLYDAIDLSTPDPPDPVSP